MTKAVRQMVAERLETAINALGDVSNFIHELGLADNTFTIDSKIERTASDILLIALAIGFHVDGDEDGTHVKEKK